ncbi:MAG: glycosyltransferase [Saprospiraceae bacterium]
MNNGNTILSNHLHPLTAGNPTVAVQHAFISVVRVLESPQELRTLANEVNTTGHFLQRHFTDFELVFVDNGQHLDVTNNLAHLSAEIRKNIFIIHLSTPTNFNNAVLAGLDRANGDYTILLEQVFWRQPKLLLDLYQNTQAGFDVVYLRASQENKRKFRPLHRLFYAIMRRYSDLQIDKNAHHTRIISRRALNSLLKLRENLRFMKAIYSLVGYPTTSIEVGEKIQDEQQRFGEQFQTSLIAITSFTTFLRTLLLWIFLFSIGFLLLVMYNAVKVKITNIDIFGTYHEALSGWAFLVIIMSVFFAITCLNLYIMSIYLSNIYLEIKQRPLYIIESVTRC